MQAADAVVGPACALAPLPGGSSAGGGGGLTGLLPQIGSGLVSFVLRRSSGAGVASTKEPSAQELEAALAAALQRLPPQHDDSSTPSGRSSSTKSGEARSGGSGGVAVMDAGAVARAMHEALTRLQYVLHVDAAVAESLLHEHSYDVDAALQAGMRGSGAPPAGASAASAVCEERYCPGDAASHTSGGAAVGLCGRAREPSPPCLVCFEPACASVSLPCGHVTCDACWRGILRARLDDGDPWRTCCAAPG